MKTLSTIAVVFLIRWIDRRSREQRLVEETEFILKEVMKEP